VAALRLGLIGAGRWGRAYIRTIGAMAEATLAAVASSNAETAALAPPGCAVTEDWRALVAMPEVEAVIVATPPLLHGEMALAALAAGKPVLVEKPFTLSLREAEAVVASARHRGLALMVEHTYLLAPAFRELVRRVPTLGPLRQLRGRANAEGPFRPDVPVLWDWGAHDVAMCIAIAGRPNGQAARVVERRASTANAETVGISLQWEDGPVGDIVVGNIAAPKRRRFEAIGAEGTLVFDDLAADKLTLRRGDAAPEPIAVAPVLPLTEAVAAFAAAARRPPDEAMLAMATDVVRVLEACERSVAASR
jgi:predicted dehydrogenase